MRLMRCYRSDLGGYHPITAGWCDVFDFIFGIWRGKAVRCERLAQVYISQLVFDLCAAVMDRPSQWALLKVLMATTVVLTWKA
jgi:hypothetical protein